MMRVRPRLSAAILVGSLPLVIACGGSDQTPPQTPANATATSSNQATPAASGAGGSIKTLQAAPDSLKVDKVGGSDGALKPDGQMDIVLTAEVEGPLASLFLISTNAAGDPNGEYQSDTITGLDQLPKDFPIAVKAGMLTAGMGVWEGDKMLSKPDGSIETLSPGPHKLTIYVASTGILQPGSSVRIYAGRPDKSIVKGPVAKL